MGCRPDAHRGHQRARGVAYQPPAQLVALEPRRAPPRVLEVTGDGPGQLVEVAVEPVRRVMAGHASRTIRGRRD